MASISRRTIRWTTQDGEPRSTEKYEALYQDRAGKRHRRLFVLKKDARRWLDEQTAGMVTGQWADPRAGKETVVSYGERWLARQVIATSTATAYRTVLSNHIYPVLGAKRMDAINRADVQSFVKSWETTAAARTVESRYSILAILFARCGQGPGHPGIAVCRHQAAQDRTEIGTGADHGRDGVGTS